MSAIHPGNLHGTGTRMNKTRYHYSRQKVQDAQKGKLDEQADAKKDEPEPKSSPNSMILVVLIVLVCVTWGIAATAYFGIIDYKGMLARSSNVSAADAVDYASSLYPFQYEAMRHPLKFIGSFLTAIDDGITNFFTFTKAPFKIIDKRRQATVAPARRLKKFVDLSKRDAPSEQLHKDTVVTPSDKKSQDRVDVEKPKTPKATEEEKRTESPKPNTDKSDSRRNENERQEAEKPRDKQKTAGSSEQKSTGDEPKSAEVETGQEPEKPKDVSLTLNLHLFVGQEYAINESHLLSDMGSVLQIGKKSSQKVTKNSDPTPKCAKSDSKELFFTLFPINKPNVAFCNGNPPVRRLILDGLVQNPSDYTPHNVAPPPPADFYHGNTKLVIDSIPNDGKLSSQVVMPQVTVKTQKFSNHHSNVGNPQISKKLVIDTNPFPNDNNSGNFGENHKKTDNSRPKFCGRNCFLALRILNKNSLPRNGPNHIKKQKTFTRLTLPNVLPKTPVRCSKISNSEVFIFFGQKFALPNPTNRYIFTINPKGENLKVNENLHFPQKEVKSEDAGKSDHNPKNPRHASKTAQNRKMDSRSKKSVGNPGHFKEIVPLSASSRCVVNIRNFISRKIIFRGVRRVVFDRILRNMRYSFGHGLRFRGVTNPCSQRMIWHFLKYDLTKMIHRKTNGLSVPRNIRNVLHFAKYGSSRTMYRKTNGGVMNRRTRKALTKAKHDSAKMALRKTNGISIGRRIRNVFRSTKHDTAKMSLRNVDNPSFVRNVQSVQFLQGRKVIVREVTPPPSPRLIQRLSPLVTSQKIRSHDLRRFRMIIPPPSHRVIRTAHHIITSQKLNHHIVRSPSMRRVLQNADVVVNRKRLFRGTIINPSAPLRNDEINPNSSPVEEKIIIRAMSDPTSQRVILKGKSGCIGHVKSSRGVMNPSTGKITRDSEVRLLNRKVTSGSTVMFQVGRFVREAMERERRLLFSRLATAGTVGFDRQILMPKLRDLPSKRQKIILETKLTPRQKVKQKFSRMFDRACDVINAFALVIRKMNIVERTYNILPKKVKGSLEKAKNVTVISKILDITFNTTLNDVIEITKGSSNKIWGIIHEKLMNFYNFLNKKPSMKNFFTHLSRFGQKMQRKYEKVSDMVAKNFVKLQYNQKLLTSILITLSVVGLYHIFYSCVDSIVPYRRR